MSLCPHCGRTPVSDEFACVYCRGFAHRPAQQSLDLRAVDYREPSVESLAYPYRPASENL